MLYEFFYSIIKTQDGGKGSGNFGHKGRPAKRGGSGKGMTKSLDAEQLNNIWEEYVKRVNSDEKYDHNGFVYKMLNSKSWEKNKKKTLRLLNKVIETGEGVFKTDADVDEAERLYNEAVANKDKKTAEKIKRMLRWNMAIEAMYDVGCDMYGEEINQIQNNEEPQQQLVNEIEKENKKEISKGYDISNDSDIFNEKGEAEIEFNEINYNVFTKKEIGNVLKGFGNFKDNTLAAQQFKQILELNKSQFINFMNNTDLQNKYKDIEDYANDICDVEGLGIFLEYPSLMNDDIKNKYFAVAKEIVGDKDYLQKMTNQQEFRQVDIQRTITKKTAKLKGLQAYYTNVLLTAQDDFQKERESFIQQHLFEMIKTNFRESYMDNQVFYNMCRVLGLSGTLTNDKINDAKKRILRNALCDPNNFLADPMTSINMYTALLLLENEPESKRARFSNLNMYKEAHELIEMYRDKTDEATVDINVSKYMDMVKLNPLQVKLYQGTRSTFNNDYIPELSTRLKKPCDADWEMIKQRVINGDFYTRSDRYLSSGGKMFAMTLMNKLEDYYDNKLKSLSEDEKKEKMTELFMDLENVLYNPSYCNDDDKVDEFLKKYSDVFDESTMRYSTMPVVNEDFIKNCKSFITDDLTWEEESQLQCDAYYRSRLGKIFDLSAFDLYNAFAFSYQNPTKLTDGILACNEKLFKQRTQRFKDCCSNDKDVDENMQAVANEIKQCILAEGNKMNAYLGLFYYTCLENGWEADDVFNMSENDIKNVIFDTGSGITDGEIDYDRSYAKDYNIKTVEMRFDGVELKGNLIKSNTDDLDKDIDFISNIKYSEDSVISEKSIKQYKNKKNRQFFKECDINDNKEIFKDRLYNKDYMQSKEATKNYQEAIDTTLKDLFIDYNERKYATSEKEAEEQLSNDLNNLENVLNSKISRALMTKNYDKAAAYWAVLAINDKTKFLNKDTIFDNIFKPALNDMKNLRDNRKVPGYDTQEKYLKRHLGNFAAESPQLTQGNSTEKAKNQNKNLNKYDIENNMPSAIKSNRINDRYQKVKNKPDVKTNFLDTTVIKDTKLDKNWNSNMAINFLQKLVPLLNLPKNFFKETILGDNVEDKQKGEDYIGNDITLKNNYKTDSEFAKIRQNNVTKGTAEPVIEKIKSAFKNKYQYSYDDLRQLISFITTSGREYTSALQEDNEGMGSFMRMITASAPVYEGEFCRFENPSDEYRDYDNIKIGDSITFNAQHFTYDAKSFGKKACEYFGKKCFRVKGKVPFLNMMPYVRGGKLTEWEGLIAGCFKVVNIQKGIKVYNADPDVVYDLEFDWGKWKSYLHANAKMFANQIGLYDRNGKMKVKDFLNRLLKLALMSR